MELYDNLTQLMEDIKKAGEPKVYTETRLDILNINMFLEELEKIYPEQVKLIRDILDTMEN